MAVIKWKNKIIKIRSKREKSQMQILIIETLFIQSIIKCENFQGLSIHTFISTSKTVKKRVKRGKRVWIYIYIEEFSIISVAIPYFAVKKKLIRFYNTNLKSKLWTNERTRSKTFRILFQQQKPTRCYVRFVCILKM